MDEATSPDLEMIKALLASMQGNGNGQMYADHDDEDDDDYDETEDDEDDELFEHNIQAMVNGYGGGMEHHGGEHPNMQTMNFLQGLISMTNNAQYGAGDPSMGTGMDPEFDMGGQPMDNDSRGGYLPNMMPNTDMVALAGAFGAGLTGAFAGQQPGGRHDDYLYDDGEVISDEEEDDDDDIDDEEDDLEDDEDSSDGHPGMSMPSGSMMAAAGLLAGGAALSAYQNYSSAHHQPAAIMPPPQQMPSLHANQQHPPRIEYAHPPAAQLPSSTSRTSAPPATLPLRSGGSVIRTDPFAALGTAIGGLAVGNAVLRPIVSNFLGNGGAGTVVNPLENAAVQTRVHHTNDAIDSLSSALGATHLGPNSPMGTMSGQRPQEMPRDDKARLTTILPKVGDYDDTSLGSATSSCMNSGCGKSDTESVGKKTPTPPNADPNGGSCASITDLASATESMRDSDDNQSEVHNVTGNLSEFDADINEKMHQYTVGPLPMIVEKPSYGWGSMLGHEKAKEALTRLFKMKSFPPVFEGMEGSCKGVLLFGPSGSGKTSLSRALAKEANDSVFVGVSSLYVIKHAPVDAVKIVRWAFEEARKFHPSVVLFDDIDILSHHPPAMRDSAAAAKQEILAQVKGRTAIHPVYEAPGDIQSLNEEILLLGTTNRPWFLEDQLRRLFAYNIHVRLPQEKARHGLFRMFLQNMPNTITNEEFEALVLKSEGFSAAEINSIIRQASLRVHVNNADGCDIQHLTYNHIAETMTQFTSAFNEDLKHQYSMYIKQATHTIDNPSGTKEKKGKQPGVVKFSKRLARSLASAVLSVID